MILIFSLICLFSAIGIGAMVALRMWQIETGRVRTKGGMAFPYSLFIEDVAKKVKDAGKRFSLIAAAKTLYFMSQVFDRAKGLARRYVVRMEKKLVRENRATETKQGAVSLFFKDIAEHKRSLKAQVRRQARMLD